MNSHSTWFDTVLFTFLSPGLDPFDALQQENFDINFTFINLLLSMDWPADSMQWLT